MWILPGAGVVSKDRARLAKWDFFVSYAQTDRAWAEWIAWELEHDGYRVLIQAWDMAAGANWVNSMQEGVARAAHTIALLSPDYIRSTYGAAEWQAAWRDDPLGKQRKLIVLRVAECERPGLLGSLVSTDLFGYTEDRTRSELRRVIDEVVSERGKPARQPSFPGPGGAPAVEVQPLFPGALPGRRQRQAMQHRTRLAPASRWRLRTSLGALVVVALTLGWTSGVFQAVVREIRFGQRTIKDPSSLGALPPPDTLIWAELPVFTASGPTVFERSLTTPAPGWPVGHSDTVDTKFQNGAYVIHPLSKQYAEYVAAPAPPETFVSDVVVTATASLQSGQGLWGVWCRGVDSSPSNAYMFLISHTGAVEITLMDFHDGTGWKHLDGVDVSKPITISARCADLPHAPVLLTMAVNGREILNYRPKKVLSPGYSGITAQPFEDVDGPIATDSFTEFRLSRYRDG